MTMPQATNNAFASIDELMEVAREIRSDIYAVASDGNDGMTIDADELDWPDLAIAYDRLNMVLQRASAGGIKAASEIAVESLVRACGGDWWAEHGSYPRSEWRQQVCSGETQRGYWEWVVASAEADEVSDADLMSMATKAQQ